MIRVRGRHHLFYLLVGTGFLYLLFVDLTGIGIPCLFHLATGLKCPGCGSTTMVRCLASLDFQGAYAANPFLFLSLPFLLFEAIYAGFYLPARKRRVLVNDIVLALYVLSLLAFGIGRNALGI